MTQAPLPLSMENVSIDHDLARLIDHTLLRPEATITNIERLCDEARRPGVASARINPSHVALRARFLKENDVKISTVIGFPLGATSTAAKPYETEVAIRD